MDDAQQKAVFAASRYILAIIGGVIVKLGWANDETVQIVIGAVVAIAPAAWGIWVAFHTEKKTQVRETAAVNAGIALSNETSTPTPSVSPELAKAIIRDYAPAVQPGTEGKP